MVTSGHYKDKFSEAIIHHLPHFYVKIKTSVHMPIPKHLYICPSQNICIYVHPKTSVQWPSQNHLLTTLCRWFLVCKVVLYNRKPAHSTLTNVYNRKPAHSIKPYQCLQQKTCSLNQTLPMFGHKRWHFNSSKEWWGWGLWCLMPLSTICQLYFGSLSKRTQYHSFKIHSLQTYFSTSPFMLLHTDIFSQWINFYFSGASLNFNLVLIL